MRRDWFQIITNIGVIIGLGLLIFELNQSNTHTRAQLQSLNFQFAHENIGLKIGEKASAVFALPRSTHLHDMTSEQQVIVESYYEQILHELEHRLVMHREFELLTDEETFRRTATGRASSIFWRQDARDWWEVTREYMNGNPIANELRFIFDEGLQLANQRGADESIANSVSGVADL